MAATTQFNGGSNNRVGRLARDIPPRLPDPAPARKSSDDNPGRGWYKNHVQHITLRPAGNLDDLAKRWQALETRTSPGFFQSWTFLGCVAAERFARARLLSVTQDGADIALALIGQGARRGWLNQTGNPTQDSVFIEHNTLLATPDARITDALRAASAPSLVLSGIDDATLRSAQAAGWLHHQQTRWAPAIDLLALGRPYLETLSANARAQIRRSQRLYGPDLHLAPAPTLEHAQSWFREMVVLHQQSWQARGKPGAFAHPHMGDFHAALIARAWPEGGADLLRITAAGRHVGTLYMLNRAGRVHSYQSGFAPAADSREKPGLVSHALAIEHYASAGAHTYDLLAGAERYKLTLAQGGQNLHWAALHRPWSAAGLAARAKRIILASRGQDGGETLKVVPKASNPSGRTETPASAPTRPGPSCSG